jgi:hypothetical protein
LLTGAEAPFDFGLPWPQPFGRIAKTSVQFGSPCRIVVEEPLRFMILGFRFEIKNVQFVNYFFYSSIGISKSYIFIVKFFGSYKD